MAGKAKGAQTTHTAERWQQILCLMDEAYGDYLKGMAELRKRVVGDVKRKLNDGEGLDRSRADRNLSWASFSFDVETRPEVGLRT